MRNSRPNSAKAPDTVTFRRRALNVVANIPEGKVMTYGQVALLAGKPGCARQVGQLLRGLTESGYPWQRVINAQGRVSTDKIGPGEYQRALLETEGLRFDASGRLPLKACQWWPPEA